eukprot:COSAG06_NODE_1272_length_10054_cov_52.873430_2_plen_271_part_00
MLPERSSASLCRWCGAPPSGGAAWASAGQGCSLSLKSMRAAVAAVCGLGIGRPGLLAFPREGRKRRPWRQCAASASAGQGCSLSLERDASGARGGSVRLGHRPARAARSPSRACGRPWRQCAASPGGMSPSFFLSCLSAPVPPPDVGVTADVGKRAGMYAPPGGSSVVVAASAGRCSLAQSKRRSRRQDAAASSRTVCCPVSVHVGRARRPGAAALLGGIGWSGKSPLSARGQSSRSSVADAKASARRGGGLASSGRGWLGRGAVRRIGR